MVVTKDYGISISEIEMSSVTDLKPYEEAYNLSKRICDENMWHMGMYVQCAVGVAVENVFNGGKSTLKYFEEPLFAEAIKEMSMTQEEKDKRDIEKLILNEMKWQTHTTQLGLPKTDAN